MKGDFSVGVDDRIPRSVQSPMPFSLHAKVVRLKVFVDLQIWDPHLFDELHLLLGIPALVAYRPKNANTLTVFVTTLQHVQVGKCILAATSQDVGTANEKDFSLEIGQR